MKDYARRLKALVGPLHEEARAHIDAQCPMAPGIVFRATAPLLLILLEMEQS